MRLSTIFRPDERLGVSKALLPVGRPPISLIEHQINKLDHAGVTAIVAGVGDHDNVADYVRSVYKDHDKVHAAYYENQLGNGGDLVRAVRDYPELFGSYTLITCVDVLLDVSEAAFLDFHKAAGGELSIALTRIRGVPNQDAYYIDDEGRVIYCGEADSNYVSEREAADDCSFRGSSTGALIANTAMLLALDWQPENGPLSVYRQLVGTAMEHSSMYAFDNGISLFTDVGTVDSWNAVQAGAEAITPYLHYASQPHERRVAS